MAGRRELHRCCCVDTATPHHQVTSFLSQLRCVRQGRHTGPGRPTGWGLMGRLAVRLGQGLPVRRERWDAFPRKGGENSESWQALGP